MPYFVITSDEDGGHVQQMSEDELLQALNPDPDVCLGALECSNAQANVAEPEVNYWGESYLIIKGEIVVPREEQVVTRIVV